jgi:hypothetical protein
MHPIVSRTYLILTLMAAGSLSVLAQAEGESPYSSSTVDTPPGSSFLDDNLTFIILAVIFLLLFVFLFVKGRRRV